MSSFPRILLVVALAVGLLLAGLLFTTMLWVGCSENLHPGTDRTRACEAWSGGLGGLILLALPPLLVLVGGFLPWRRRFSLVVMVCVVLGFAAVWTYLLLVVSGNIGDTTLG